MQPVILGTSDVWLGDFLIVSAKNPSKGAVLARRVKVAASLDSVACFASDNDPALSLGRDGIGAIEMLKRPLSIIRASIGSSADTKFGEARFALNRR